MKSSQGFPWQRIVLAVALSVLAHSLLLLELPKIEWPAQDKPLPQLQAKLEPLPVLKKKTAPRKPVAKIATPDKSKTEPEVIATPAFPSLASASSVSVSEQTAAETETAHTSPIASAEHPRLPRHAQLHFSVQYHAGTFKLGEIVHTLDIENDRYILRAETQTTGLVSLLRNYQLTQTSTGSIDSNGFKPQRYTEAKTDRNGTQISTALFNWDTHKISFSGAQVNNLPEQAQDILSLPYQLSQLPLENGIIPMALSTGKKITQYYLSSGNEETIHTALGELRTISVSKMHGDSEDGLIIWLALEYRLLPVKILYLDKSGEVSANMVITDIRVSDE